jgi:hypothetical protein
MQLALRYCAKELARANLSNAASARGVDGRFPAAAQPGNFVIPDNPPTKRRQYSP